MVLTLSADDDPHHERCQLVPKLTYRTRVDPTLGGWP
jgi:hypothetical protein